MMTYNGPKPIYSKIKAAAIYLLKITILAVAYHLAARLGLEMAFLQMNTSPVWPPAGIALAALLIFGYKLWPGICLGVLLGFFLHGAQLNITLGMAFGNTLEALAGVYFLKQFIGFRNPLDRIKDVVGLAFFSVLITIIGATIGTMTLRLAGAMEWHEFGTIWLTWWIGDLLGVLAVAPLLLVWISIASLRFRKSEYIEGAGLFVWIVLVTWYVFSSLPPVGAFHQALVYTIFPFTIWAALRFGQRGATIAILLVSGIAILGTVHGVGPFSLGTKNESLILLQIFLAVVSLTSLILAAAATERNKATEDLHQRVNDLAILNDSSKTFLNNFDFITLYQIICELAINRLGLDAAWIETTAPDGLEVRPVAACGISFEAIARLKTQWGIGSTVQDQREALFLEDLDADSIYQSYGIFPLIFSNKPNGTLNLLSKNKSFFKKELQLLIHSYANLAAVAIQNTWLFDEVSRGNKQLHALSQRLMKAQEEERLYLSRELHDESGQLLAALTVQLGLLERDAEMPEAVRTQVVALKHAINAIQDNLHQLATNLRPASLDHLGLITASRQFIGEFSRQYNIQVEFEVVGFQEKRLSIEIETALFRVVQESLTNVVLHAQATCVDVLLNMQKHCVVAVVEDNGVGFIPMPNGVENHLGLLGMRERVEMLGGKFEVESSPGKGTTVRVEVPCDD